MKSINFKNLCWTLLSLILYFFLILIVNNYIKKIKNFIIAFLKKYKIRKIRFIPKYSNTICHKTQIELQAKALLLPISDNLGIFINDEHYIGALDLLLTSTNELCHLKEFIEKNVYPILSSHKEFLDIGVGNGDLTKFLGKNFENITIIDNSQVALDNINAQHFPHKKSFTKIHHSIIDAELKQKFDFINFSHVIYYIDECEKKQVLRKLYKALKPGGVILIVFDEGLQRSQFMQFFGASQRLIENDIKDYLKQLPDIKIYFSIEKFISETMLAMLNIIGICFKDVGITADREKVKKHLNNYFDETQNCYIINMYQNYIVIKKPKND